MWFIGNWKMNGSKSLIEDFLKAEWSADHSICICPSYPYLSYFSNQDKLILGAQNCHEKLSGAYTGEVSASMLKEFGVKVVILGHSERRHYFSETSEQVRRKGEQVLATGLLPVICVGEPESIRKEGMALPYVLEQLKESLPNQLPDKLLIAYEPVWAIGTGLIPTLDEIEEMHRAIHDQCASSGKEVHVLYGGSVNLNNAADILKLKEVGGVLVGGASLELESFQCIMNSI